MAKRIPLTRPRSWWPIALVVVVLGPLAATAAMAAPARAGTLTVLGCKSRSHQPLPTDGWSAHREGNLGDDRRLGNTVDSCNHSDGALELTLTNDYPISANAGRVYWRYDAPSWAIITRATLWRSARVADATGRSAPVYDLRFPDISGIQERCSHLEGDCGRLGEHDEPFAAANKVELGGSGKQIYFTAGCHGQTTCEQQSFVLDAHLFASEITLRDPTSPAPGPVSGSLVQGGAQRGAQSVTVNATDQESGVYRGIVQLDGSTVAQKVLDPAGGRCTDAEPDVKGNQFLYGTPCPASAGGSLSVDTTKVSDGAHEAAVLVSDAAGNVATAWSGTIVVRNGPKGAPGAGSGSPAGGAQSGSSSGNAGARSGGSSPGPAAPGTKATSTTGKHRGHGHRRRRLRTTLRRNHRHRRNGQRVRFAGQLYTAVRRHHNWRRRRRAHRRGIVVTMQAWSRGHWVTFATARSNRRGRWHDTYRFHATVGRQRYVFRAVILRQRGNRRGSASHHVAVVVRG
jgi:hypothetical protein